MTPDWDASYAIFRILSETSITNSIYMDAQYFVFFQPVTDNYLLLMANTERITDFTHDL